MIADSADRTIDTLLLLGLPACGKSVIRRYLSTDADRSAEAGLGPTIQLDDFPYVAFMWQLEQIARGAGYDPVYFDHAMERFADPRTWYALVHLVNEDYAALDEPVTPSARPAAWVSDRLERAFGRAGMPAPLSRLSPAARQAGLASIEVSATRFASEWSARRRPPGSTVVIEFSRGGPAGSDLPMVAPYGYEHAFSLLSERILRRAVVLYVWVTPEQSRSRNHERARPGAQGTTMHHAVPDSAMDADYGMDDMSWLMEHSERPDTVTVHAHGSTFHLPVARFDNRREVEAFRGDARPTQEGGLDAQTSACLRMAFARLARPATAGRSPSG